MNGSINFDGTLSGSIAGGGGGGGSEVTITPVITEGTKIADYSIDGTAGELYAPEAGDTVEVTPTLNVGDKVADIEVNGVNKALYSRSYGYANDMHDTNSETIGGLQKGSNITPIMVKAVSYTNDISNGEKIGALTVGDTSYNVYQKANTNINYSTTEQNTGRKWIDGRDIYQITFYVQTINTADFIAILGNSNDINLDTLIKAFGSLTYNENEVKQIIPIPQYSNNNYYIRVYVMTDGGSLIGPQYSGKCCIRFELSNDSLHYYNHDLVFTIEYVKKVVE